MNWNNIKLIIGREYATRVKKKSFILTTVLTPLFMALVIVVPVLITMYQGSDRQVVSVVDNTGLLENYFKSDRHTQYIFLPPEQFSQESLKTAYSELGASTAIYVSPLDSALNASVSSYSKEPLSMDRKMAISGTVSKALRDQKLKALQIDNYDEIMAQVESDVRIDAFTLTDDGEEKKDSVEIYMVLAYLMSFLIYMFVFLFGGMVMRGVIEEKSNRIVEVIVSSVNSFDLMMGKIIGVALVALTQFTIWIVLLTGIGAGVTSIVGAKAGGMSEETVAAIQKTVANGGVHPGDDLSVPVSPEEVAEMGDIAGILEQISQINFGYMLVCFLIYFLLGYLLYAAMFAAVGSAVDNEADTNQLSLPITIPLIVGLFIMLHTFQHPSSSLSVWASIIPFTSPMVMLARIPFGVVPAWQLILSIVLLAATFVGSAYISGKIYKIGILTYGKKATFRDLFKWMTSKD